MEEDEKCKNKLELDRFLHHATRQELEGEIRKLKKENRDLLEELESEKDINNRLFDDLHAERKR
jgi:hypothetical protein